MPNQKKHLPWWVKLLIALCVLIPIGKVFRATLCG